MAKLKVYSVAVLLLQLSVSVAAATCAQDKGPSTSNPAPPDSAPKRFTVDTKTMSSKLVHVVPPVYPSKAKKKEMEGTVQLHAIVATNGSVRELTVISGDPILAESAMAAVKQWRYKPTLINNEPAEVDTVVVVIFELPK